MKVGGKVTINVIKSLLLAISFLFAIVGVITLGIVLLVPGSFTLYQFWEGIYGLVPLGAYFLFRWLRRTKRLPLVGSESAKVKRPPFE